MASDVEGFHTFPSSLTSASRKTSAVSEKTDTTWRYSIFGPNRLGCGSMLFTGPDGLWDHRVRVADEYRYVGIGTMSPEGTSEASYIWRAPQGVRHPKPKSSRVGEVGWGIPMFTDWSVPRSRHQIQMGEFRQLCEDRHTHAFQSPWYPGKDDIIPENSDAALVMNVYKSQNPHASRSNHRRVPEATPIYDNYSVQSSQEAQSHTQPDGFESYESADQNNSNNAQSVRYAQPRSRPSSRPSSRPNSRPTSRLTSRPQVGDNPPSRPSTSHSLRSSHSRTSLTGRSGARSSYPEY